MRSAVIELVHAGLTGPAGVALAADAHLRNLAPVPRWFLLPTTIGSGRSLAAGISSVEVRLGVGVGRAVIASFLGAESFYGLLLAPGADLRLRGLGFLLRDRSLGTLRVLVARTLSVGSDLAQVWVGTDPTTGTADVSPGARIGRRVSEGRRLLPVRWDEGEHLDVELPLPGPIVLAPALQARPAPGAGV
jgi:hypothetical protein